MDRFANKNRVFINGLTQNASLNEILTTASQYGRLTNYSKVSLLPQKNSQYFCCFIDFESPEQAKQFTEENQYNLFGSSPNSIVYLNHACHSKEQVPAENQLYLTNINKNFTIRDIYEVIR